MVLTVVDFGPSVVGNVVKEPQRLLKGQIVGFG